mmetsp:Transcript_11573/g.25008  ORF Transcript_11573/g.25008 Transcript_11573/m.25008 type:complete len:93 (-) Transcript_11573:1498-1776(-)
MKTELRKMLSKRSGSDASVVSEESGKPCALVRTFADDPFGVELNRTSIFAHVRSSQCDSAYEQNFKSHRASAAQGAVRTLKSRPLRVDGGSL